MLSPSEPAIGIVVFFLAEKGYGYLRLEGTREEFHFRSGNLTGRNPKRGDRVHFRLREGHQGYYADQVEIIHLA
ncbi:MAG: cold shock domain-containing protein [Lewinella sp.]